MDARMTIGEFSRASRLSAKALRFYHRQGLLEPAVVDDRNGYRLYSPEQIADAQVIRTLRGLDVPVETVREVLSAPSIRARSELVAEHLEVMERRLDETRSAVRSLRALFEVAPVAIEYRSVPASRVLAVEATIAVGDLGSWFRRSIATLSEITVRAGSGTVGPFGGIWSDELFAEERGAATVYATLLPGFDESLVDDRVTVLELPDVELAVTTHVGTDELVPRAYAALGEHVARYELGVDAPVRETYLEGFPGIDAHTVTEIGWPIFRVSR